MSEGKLRKLETPAEAFRRGVETGFAAAWEHGYIRCPRLRYRPRVTSKWPQSLKKKAKARQ